MAELGEHYGLAVDPRARIWQLSVGEQQRVEILKALYREARILILDEPTAVLTPQEADSLFVTLRAMAAEGRTVIFISHKLHEVTAVADRVTVLRGGRTVATVETATASTQSLAALMVGREVEVARRRTGDRHDRRRPARARGRHGGGRPWRRGRRRRLARRAGRRDARGRGRRRERPARARRGRHRHAAAGRRRRACRRAACSAAGDPRRAIRAGVAHVPEDRLHTGVAPSLSIASNVVLKSYRGGTASRAGRSCGCGGSASRPSS